MIELELPYPPSVNHYKKLGGLGLTKSGKMYQKRINTDETNKFYYDVWIKIRTLKATEGLKSFDKAIISVDVYVYPPDARKRDIDGILKVLLDSMQKGGLYDDDNQIARLLVTRMSIIPKGKVVVRIQELE